VEYHDNNNWNSIVFNIPKIKWFKDSYDIKPFPLTTILPIGFEQVFQYDGALPFPPFNDGIIWFLSNKFADISDFQISMFRWLQTKTKKECPKENCFMYNNYRVPLYLGGDKELWGKDAVGRTIKYQRIINFPCRIENQICIKKRFVDDGMK
ncbi:hypothetical protein CHUAL_006056, partial [Chamberlinius hualienensis]